MFSHLPSRFVNALFQANLLVTELGKLREKAYTALIHNRECEWLWSDIQIVTRQHDYTLEALERAGEGTVWNANSFVSLLRESARTIRALTECENLSDTEWGKKHRNRLVAELSPWSERTVEVWQGQWLDDARDAARKIKPRRPSDEGFSALIDFVLEVLWTQDTSALEQRDFALLTDFANSPPPLPDHSKADPSQEAVDPWAEEKTRIRALLERSGTADKGKVTPEPTGTTTSAAAAPNRNPGGGGKNAKPNGSKRQDYPTPDNFDRDKWIYEQRKAGKSIPVIRNDLERNKRGWEPLYSENGIRDAANRYADHIRVARPTGRPGKPRQP